MTCMRALPLLLASAFAFASPQALALNWVPLMKNTAFERFDEDDLEMFIQNGRKALNTAPENQVMTWENPDTKAGGDFTVLKTWEQDGRTCKDVRVRTHASGRKGNSVVSACQYGKKWKLIGAPRNASTR
jgi:surface antigen